MSLVLATRRSPLARWQAEEARRLLRAADPSLEVELSGIESAGDANRTEFQKTLFRRMFTPESDWLVEARLHFAEHRPPSLPILMGRKVDTMSAEDLLWSYVLAAYLVEGAPDRAPAFLAAIGRGRRKPHEATRQVFEMELPRFEKRVVRWLTETR